MKPLVMGHYLATELANAIGLDPANRPIRKITIEAACGEPAFAIVQFIDTDAAGKVVSVLERYALIHKPMSEVLETK